MTEFVSTHDVSQALEAARPAIERICAEVWALAELSLEEVESSSVHRRELEAAGFTITSQGTAGVPTAFVAEWRQGQGGPVVGFLPEYDALPGLGNAAVPRRQARADGKTTGHGCGHNLLGAGLVGAAIATRQVLEAQRVPGTLRVYGCAAEETEGAKLYMARAGLFDDLDACLHWHPGPLAGVLNVRMAAVNMLKLDFHGTTAHAGLEPWKGRSALDALELAAHAINQMREHLEPTARTHYVFEATGVAPNIVPDYARMWLSVRDVDRARVVTTTAWVEQIARGAALATQTRSEVTVYTGMHDLLPNTPLAERMQAHIGARRAAGLERGRAGVCACLPAADGRGGAGPRNRDRALVAGTDHRRLVGRGRRELAHADDGHRDADNAAGHCAAYLGGDGLRRHVDRGAGHAGGRARAGTDCTGYRDRRRAAPGGAG